MIGRFFITFKLHSANHTIPAKIKVRLGYDTPLLLTLFPFLNELGFLGIADMVLPNAGTSTVISNEP